jgi:uncharacterized protein with PIN domain
MRRARIVFLEKPMKPEATCPDCAAPVTRADLIKEWNATPTAKEGEIQVTIHYWRCPDCDRKFRTATRVWLKGKKAPQKDLRTGRGTTIPR